MTQEVAYRFVEALAALEESGQIDPLLDTFSEACNLSNAGSPDTFDGRSGAQQFWAHYRNAFRTVRSEIRNIVIGDDSIALEWTTHGTDCTGKEIQYDGVSLLETRGRSIVRFRAYFDPKQAAEKIPARSSVRQNLTANASSA